MALAFRAATTHSGVGTTITKPAGTVEDDIVLMVALTVGSGSGPTTPPGFASLMLQKTSQTYAFPSGTNYWNAYFKVAGASEPASYTITGGSTTWVCASYSGGHVLAPYEAAVGAFATGSSIAAGLPAMIPTSSDDMYVAFVAGVTTVAAPSFTFPVEMTERASVAHTNTDRYSRIELADRLLSTAGIGAGAQNVISTYLVAPAYVTILLRPANRAPVAPTALTVAGAQNGGTADLSGDVEVYAQFNDPDGGDLISGAAIRRKIGLGAYSYWNGTDWSAGSGFFFPTTSETETTDTWTNGVTYLVGKRYEDQAGTDGTWSDDIVVIGSAPPAVAITAPIGEIETSLPTITGDYTDAEGDDMIGLEAAVFTTDVAEAVGFDAATATAVWRSGYVATDTVSTTVDEGLPNADYVLALRVYQEGNLASEWATEEFTVTVDPPPPPYLTASFDDSINAVRLIARVPGNQLTEQQADLRHGIEGWLPDNDNTASLIGIEGVGMEVTATGPDAIVIRVTNELSTSPQDTYTEYIEFALAAGADVGTGHLEVTLLGTDGTILEVVESAPVAELPTVLVDPDPDPPDNEPFTIDLRYDVSEDFTDPRPLAVATLTAAVDIRALVDVGTTGKDVDHGEWTWRSGTSGPWLTTSPARTDDLVEPYDMGLPYVTPSDFGASGQYSVRFQAFCTDGSIEVATSTFTTIVEAEAVMGDIHEPNIDPEWLLDGTVSWAMTFDATGSTDAGRIVKNHPGLQVASSGRDRATVLITAPSPYRTNQGKALRVSLPSQAQDPAANDGLTGYGMSKRTTFLDAGLDEITFGEEVYFSYRVWIPDDFMTGYATGRHLLGIKFPCLGGGPTDPSDPFSANDSALGDTHWLSMFMPHGDDTHTTTRLGLRAWSFMYLFWGMDKHAQFPSLRQEQPMRVGATAHGDWSDTNKPILRMPYGAWCHVEQRHRMNTAAATTFSNTTGPSNGTAKDGIYQCRINGVTGMTVTDVCYLKNSTDRLNIVALQLFSGGPFSLDKPEQLLVDDFVLSSGWRS
jgi:hypothetical protein